MTDKLTKIAIIFGLVSIFCMGWTLNHYAFPDYIPPAKFQITDYGNQVTWNHDTAWNTKGIGETLLETNGYLKSMNLKMDKIIKLLDDGTINATVKDTIKKTVKADKFRWNK